jgi:hypothetical protein
MFEEWHIQPQHGLKYVGDEAPIVLIARNAATQVSPVASIKQSPFATHGSNSDSTKDNMRYPLLLH